MRRRPLFACLFVFATGCVHHAPGARYRRIDVHVEDAATSAPVAGARVVAFEAPGFAEWTVGEDAALHPPE